MSYFDHVRCQACGAAFDPEAVGGKSKQFRCPACGEVLEIRSLFGLKDAFMEEEEPDLSLDDAVPGWGDGGAEGDGDVSYEPDPGQDLDPDRQVPARRRGKKGSSAALDALKDIKKKR